MVSPADLGFYVVAYSASRLVQIAQPAINSIIFSNMSLRNKEEAKVLHDYAFRFSLLILAPGTILFIILSKFLLTLVYGRDFGAAAALFDVLVLEATLSCLAQITLQLFLALDRPGFASTVQTSSFLISGVCIAVLVPLYGSMGAAVGILVAAICRMGLLFVGLDRSLGLQFPRLWLNAEDINYIRARLLESRAI
jgi:O-antigen/teichoic acid export membrane protein